jgi:hypothetical protein
MELALVSNLFLTEEETFFVFLFFLILSYNDYFKFSKLPFSF